MQPMHRGGVRDAAESAAHYVRRRLNVDPMLCGVVVELDRLSTGLGRLWGAWNSSKVSIVFKSEQSHMNHSWNYPYRENTGVEASSMQLGVARTVCV